MGYRRRLVRAVLVLATAAASFGPLDTAFAQVVERGSIRSEDGEFASTSHPSLPAWEDNAVFPVSLATPRADSCVPREQCCKVCSKGKACGNTCISRAYECHKGRGCACNEAEVCQ